jgi:hypothetical protein
VLSWDGTTLYIGVWDDATVQDDIFVLHRTKMLGTLDP